MALKERIDQELKAALLGGDRLKGEVLRGLKAMIHNEELASGKRDDGLDDTVIEQLVAKEVKKRNESAGIYDEANRPELAKKERDEAVILGRYLSEQLDEDEIKSVIDRIIKELTASNTMNLPVLTISQAGQVIGAVKKETGNSADGSTIARLVKNKLIQN